jgi:hypothetical protein
MKNLFLILTITAFFILPVNTSYAQLGVKQPEFGSGIKVSPKESAETLVQNIISNSIALIFTFAGVAVLIMFIWGVTGLIISGGDKEKLAGARRRITWALIGLVLLSLAFVVIQALGQIIGFNPLGKLRIPSFGSTDYQLEERLRQRNDRFGTGGTGNVE